VPRGSSKLYLGLLWKSDCPTTLWRIVRYHNLPWAKKKDAALGTQGADSLERLTVLELLSNWNNRSKARYRAPVIGRIQNRFVAAYMITPFGIPESL